MTAILRKATIGLGPAGEFAAVPPVDHWYYREARPRGAQAVQSVGPERIGMSPLHSRAATARCSAPRRTGSTVPLQLDCSRHSCGFTSVCPCSGTSSSTNRAVGWRYSPSRLLLLPLSLPLFLGSRIHKGRYRRPIWYWTLYGTPITRPTKG